MKTPTLSIIVAAASFGLASVAFAGSGDKVSFEKLDTNKDGYIERTDVPADHELAALFANYDLDRDNRLSASEFQAYTGEREQEEAE